MITKNILLAGVGGQGIILASDLLTEVMMRAGHDVKKSEIHGMAQRGGSVMSHVRYGETVYSPIIPMKQCDALLSFEELETARYLDYLKPGARVIVNSQRVAPPAVISGQAEYPDVTPLLKARTDRVHFVPGNEIAHELGNSRGVNIVLLGALSQLVDIPEQVWIDTLNEKLKEKIRAINIEGFRKGRKFALE